MTELIILRIVHVLGGVFWVGSGLFTVLFLMPVLSHVGPAATAVLLGLQQRGLYVALPIVGLLTIGSGARLMWMTSDGLGRAYLASSTGRTLIGSALLAILAFAVVMLVLRPASARVMALTHRVSSAHHATQREELLRELVTFRHRARAASVVSLLLVLLSTVGMSAARYLR
jgi:uncharacterized membrane protein